jgi:hypothetical protein
MEVSGQLHAPTALFPGGTPVPIAKEVGCAPEPLWTFRRTERSLVLVGNPNSGSSGLQSSHYTD